MKGRSALIIGGGIAGLTSAIALGQRGRYIVEASVAICNSQLGKGPQVDQAKATKEMAEVVSQPI